VLELGRGEIPDIVLNQLFKHTQLETSFGIIMLALVDRRPQVVNLKQMLEAFIKFRREVVTRRTRFDLARAEERAHILAGLRKAVEQLDLVIRLIRQADSPDAARTALMSQLELSEIQAKAILDMRLQRLTQLERHKIVEEHEQVLALIEELKGILASDARLMAIIRQEILAIRDEFGDARRTEIVVETTDLTIEDLLADEEMVVTITRSGYIKRTHVEAYRSQRRGGKGVMGMETKEEDIVDDLFIASTHSYLLFFTTKGKVHWLKVHEIPEGGRQAKGKAMVNLLSLGDGETVATCVPVRNFDAGGGFILFATRQGKVKKTELESYSHPRAGGIQAIGLEDGDEVITARRTDGRREVMIATKLGMIIRFNEEEVRPMGRGAAGVRGIDVEDNDEVIAADVVQEGVNILTITERGHGKRTPLDEYRLQGRAGKGIIDIKTGGRNGNVVGMLQVHDSDDILVITTKGKMIRFHAAEVSSQGRNTWGVRIIDLDPDDKVGSVARVDAETTAPAEAQ
jgi:DNA gyrase subunit A